MAFAPPTDGPPPSPMLDPAAAQEAGRPASAVAGLTAGSQLTAPPGPDVSGVLSLGQKIVEGLLALSQAAPVIGPDMDQAQAIVINALGKFSAGATGTGTSPAAPLAGPQMQTQAPPPKGAVVGQAGPQFPGAVTSNSRPF